MSENNAQIVLDIMGNITDGISNVYTPISDGTKEINKSGISEQLKEAWEEMEDQVFNLIEETEVAWALENDVEDEIDPDE